MLVQQLELDLQLGNTMEDILRKQHQRIVILSMALLYLGILSVWQTNVTASPDELWTLASFSKSIYTLWIAFFAGMVAALIFVHKSNRELKDHASSAPNAELALGA
jgi:uncharacterized membrane protein